MLRIFKKNQNSAQLELDIPREIEKDRNYDLGGRSFYFFDFDDNVAFLSTPIYIFHKETKQEVPLSSGEFALVHTKVGKEGSYRDYEFDWDDKVGTFRCFRDADLSLLDKFIWQKKQRFVTDVEIALRHPDFHWKGPSWSCFYHAAFNQRPISIITARGHNPQTIKDGIYVLFKGGFLPAIPNYLSIYPVSHPGVRFELGDKDLKLSTARLKQLAISASVEKAIEAYGNSSHHRFGMSDDDPKNIQLIIEEMARLKSKHPALSFFVIETQNGGYVKHEVYPDSVRSESTEDQQIPLL